MQCFRCRSRGYFTAHQASRVIYAFSHHPDKLRALEMMEPRLLPMTCSESKDIMGAFSFQEDKLRALCVVKRYLADSNTRMGKEHISNCFVFEEDRKRALNILFTVRGYIYDVVPAGGYQLYGCLGSSLSQARPLHVALYGLPHEQSRFTPGKGVIEVPNRAQPRLLPSKYTGHPSYAYRRGRDYAQDRGYPGCGAYGEHLYYPGNPGGYCPAKSPLYNVYPAGAPPLVMHHSSSVPAGYQRHTSYY